jgi:polysaccharide export outer membrane protein
MRSVECPPLLALILALASGCSAGPYVWVDALPAAPPVEDAYIINPGDVLNIRVYNQDTISLKVHVGPDGKISVPLVGEIDTRGMRTSTLAHMVEEHLKPYVIAPSVSITLEEVQPVRVSVVGEVAHAGVFTAPAGSNVLQALALAGGLTEYADKDRIFVLRVRPSGPLLRVRMTYKDLTRGTGKSAAFALEGGDTVVVE